MWTSIERRPLLVDVIVAVVAFAFFGVLDVTRTGWQTLPVDALFALAVAFRRRSPGVGLAIAWVGAVVQLVVLPSFINGDVLIAVVIFATSLARQPVVQRLGLVSSVAGGIIASVKLVLVTGDFLPHGQSDSQEAFSRVIYSVGVAGVVAAALALFWLLGMIARVRRELLTARLERLEGEQDLLRAELRVAQETERTRISREMHDAIGHSLAVIIAQSDGARYAVAKNPAAATDALGVINRSARSALDDVSELLSVLATSTGHEGSLGVADLDTLLTNMESSGLAISFNETGDRLDLSRSCDLALFRVVQEVLTNALKHGGPGTTVSVALTWSTQAVTVDSVTTETDGPDLLGRDADGPDLLGRAEADDGPPSAEPAPTRGGHGIAGMVERVRLVGGSVTAGPRADGVRGFAVHATIPHAPGGAE
ncbi:sensor histidine kinase [Frondihabitans peucedani]|uniref:histidine kinase n=1 Tax=Frondihabitans peucedani TaxID=598626 RepID=A0ABP8DXB6_9MICO